MVTQRPLLLILDGHSSHVGLEGVKLATDSSVTLLQLPSHTTDKLQPLNIALFGPLQAKWDQQLIIHQWTMGFTPISKAMFVDIVCDMWPSAMTPSSIKSGFSILGIYPPDRNKFPVSSFDLKKLALYLQSHPPLPLQVEVLVPKQPVSLQHGYMPDATKCSSLLTSLKEVLHQTLGGQQQTKSEEMWKQQQIQ